MNEEIVNIANVGKSFEIGGEDFWALKDVNLKIMSGEFTGFIGPSGSGKTTLLNLIGALDKPTTGSISFSNQSLQSLSPSEAADIRAQDIGFIFQSYYLLPHYTVFENVEYPLLLLKIPAEERKKAVLDALKWVGLEDRADSRPTQLSGGQSQRIAIAIAMVSQPPFTLNPTSGWCRGLPMRG